jgi:lipoprotein-anchoring transpeptidase ErfK/SrfK
MRRRKILLWIVLLLPYIGLLIIWQFNEQQMSSIRNSTVVVISKENMTLSVYDFKGKINASYPVATSKNFGNKEKVGDMKTPEGVFNIADIQKSGNWKHDFGDGMGAVEGAYGPYFIRLRTPGHTGIGIHGTHDDTTIGSRVTEGCIRLRNEDLEKLVKYLRINNVVIIMPSKNDLIQE